VRAGVAGGEQVADAADHQEQRRQRGQQAGDPDPEVVDHLVEVAGGG
jgi:hypothetical protein